MKSVNKAISQQIIIRPPYITPLYPVPNRFMTTQQERSDAYLRALAELPNQPPRIDRTERQFSDVDAATKFVESRGHKLSPLLKPLIEQPRFEQHSPEWFAARRLSLTASTFGAACNNAEYGNPLEVFKNKCETNRGPITSSRALEYMAWGTHYEDAAAHKFEQETGELILDFGLISHHRLFEMRPPETSVLDWHNLIHSDERPECISEEQWQEILSLRFVKGSPDGITTSGCVVEIKCPKTQIDHTKIKRMYLHQLLLNMAIAGADTGYFIQYRPRENAFFGEEYSCQIVKMPEGWFNEETKQAHDLTWSKIMEFKKTGVIPEPFASKIQLVEGLGEVIKFESKRKRKTTLKPVADEKTTETLKRSIDLCAFRDDPDDGQPLLKKKVLAADSECEVKEINLLI